MKTLQGALVLGLVSLGFLTQACGGAVEGNENGSSTTTTTTTTGNQKTGTSTSTSTSTGTSTGTTTGEGISPPAQIAVVRAESNEATSAHLTATTSIPENPAPAVDVTISDPNLVLALYNETLSLNQIPSGAPISCPADFGVTYHLEFDGSCNAEGCAAPVLFTADFPPDGCQFLTSAQFSNTLATTPTYWQDLASDFSIQESTIYPYEPPSLSGN